MKRTQSKAQPSLLRQLNTRQVLAAIQAHGPLSRAEITRHTGISGPTVTRTVSALIEANLLEEGELRQSALGRPGRVVGLATSSVAVLGAVVQPERCEVVCAGLDGEIHEPHLRVFPTPTTYSELIKAFVKNCRHVIQEERKTVLGLGISIPGLLNQRTKRTLVSPNLHQTDNHQLGEDLAGELKLETVIMQESKALCLAERTFGAAKDVADFAMLDITGGLGLGIVQGGRQLEGHSGLAGELGHITVELDGKRCGCGNRGCLETVATDTALAALVSERQGRRLTMDEVIAGAQSGQLKVEAECDRVLQYLAVGMAAVINVFNPQKLFVYGKLFDVQPGLFERLVQRTQQRALAPSLADCAIIRARGSKRQGALAAIIQRLTGMVEGDEQ
jgi:N-acetylglucosamine repressor